MSIQITPYRETVYLFQGDDIARLTELESAVKLAQQESKTEGATRLLSEPDEVSKAQEAYDVFLVEAKERAVKVVMQALPRKKWAELVAANPPRDNHPSDQQSGVNEETFSEAVVPLSIVEPTFETDAERDVFLERLSSAQWDQLFSVAFVINRFNYTLPKGR